MICAVLLVGLTGCGESADRRERFQRGMAVYQAHCASCHEEGIAGAPTIDDNGAWQLRLASGSESLLQNVIDGLLPGMPPRGLCNRCTDEQLADAVAYMISSVN